MNKLVNKTLALSLILSPMLLAETIELEEAQVEATVNSVKINDVSGEELTPFLLGQINTLISGGLFPIIKSVLIKNMKLGCEIANQLSGTG